MSEKQLNVLFSEQAEESGLAQEEKKYQDVLTCLFFSYAEKKYCVEINDVREIIEFPLFVPYPVDMSFSLGVFNLRGNVVSIMDPRGHYTELLKEKGVKSQQFFSHLKLRLILFELEEELVALPVYDVGKAVVELHSFREGSDFVPIENIPYEKFSIKSLSKGD